MKNFAIFLPVFILGCGSGENSDVSNKTGLDGSSNSSSELNEIVNDYNVRINTIDSQGDPLQVSSVQWWKLADDNGLDPISCETEYCNIDVPLLRPSGGVQEVSKNSLPCDTETCSTWDIVFKVDEPILIEARVTIQESSDAGSCVVINYFYYAKAYFDVDAGSEQIIDLQLTKQIDGVCPS
ncbi:MAG: hypothetical protein HRU20_17255 [Pseudomonadales bacterium]|nr:hypothetical protein [Pseudomonadales bacterium]